MEERVDIIITDRVAPTIEKKLLGIAGAAKTADTALAAMKTSLAAVLPGLAAAAAQMPKIATAMAATAKATTTLSKAQAANTIGLAQHTTALNTNLSASSALMGVRAKEAAGKYIVGATSAMQAQTIALSANTAAVHANAAAYQLLGGARAKAAAVMPFMGMTGAAYGGSGGGTGSGNVSSLRGMGGGGAAAAVMPFMGMTGAAYGGGAGGLGGMSPSAVAGMGGKFSALNKQVKATTLSLVGLGQILRVLFLTYFAVAAAERILSLADAFTELTNKLNVVSAGVADTALQMDKLFKIAQSSRTSLDAIGTLYQRLSLAMRHMGVTSDGVRKVVENVSKSLIAGGAATMETTSAIRQLSQAFNKGKADGDEFRSMMENAPLLMDLVAEEMGVARHELLGMAEQGKITAAVMFRAFSDGAAVQALFAKTTITMGHAIVQLNNALTMYLGKANQSAKATENLAKWISFTAENVDILVLSIKVLLTVIAVAKWAAIRKAIMDIGFAIRYAFATMSSGGLVVIGLTTIIGLLGVVKNRIDAAARAADQLKYAEAVKGLDYSGQEAGRFQAARFDEVRTSLYNQIDALRTLHGVYGEELAVEEEWAKVQERIGYKLTPYFAKQMHELIERIVHATAVQKAAGEVWGETEGVVEKLKIRIDALDAAYAAKGIEQYNRLSEEQQKILEETLRLQGMSTEQLKVYQDEQARRIALENLEKSIIDRTSGARQILAQSIDIVNKSMAEGTMLSVDGNRLLKEYADTLDAMNGIVKEQAKETHKLTPYLQSLRDIYRQNHGELYMLSIDMRVLSELYNSGALSAGAYERSSAGVSASFRELRADLLDSSSATEAFLMAFERMAAGISSLATELSYVISGALDNMTDGFGRLFAQWAVFGEKMRFIDVFRQIVAQMIQSLIALTTQYIIVGIARQFAGFLSPSKINTVPTQYGALGGYSGFGMGGAFAMGGYTGYGNEDEIAGLVHGKEFVVNARATKRNRSALEHMNNTGQLPGGVNVQVINNTPSRISVQQVSPTDVRIIAEQVVAERAGSAVSNDIGNPNSGVSRSLNTHTYAGRRRS